MREPDVPTATVTAMRLSRVHRAAAALLTLGLLVKGSAYAVAVRPEQVDQVDGETLTCTPFAGGCFSLVDASSGGPVGVDGDGWSVGEEGAGATPLRLQATGLGSYLLYGPDAQMIAAGDDSAITITTEAGPADGLGHVQQRLRTSAHQPGNGQDLDVGEDQRLTQSPEANSDAGWSLVETTDCDEFPEIPTNTTGDPFVGESPDAAVRGFFDSHTHVSAFSFLGGSIHCGRPWSPYGVTVALSDCPDHVDGGVGVIVESLFRDGSFDTSHAPDGWPTFEGWPQPGSLTHEGTYWRWIERAWRGGLRVMVNDLVDNRALCELYPLNDGTECNDMANVRDQAADMVALQDYIDAQFGGPGEGFFRLVDSPYDAREVINEGKLAVVLGVEVSEVLDCGLDAGEPTCDEAQIDEGLDELLELGVRSVFPVHKFDNALGGTAYDGGINGLIVNAGNRHVTGEWWDPQPCEPGAESDNTVLSPEGTLSEFVQPVIGIFGDTIEPILQDELPSYGPGPHCNPKGLTDLGEHMINVMIDRHMILETDHMSVRARNQALDILEERNYSGLITSHGWGDKSSQRRLADLGGVVAPYASSLPDFIKQWRTAKEAASPDHLFGIGFGTDTNGLGGQPNARDGNEDDPVEYPYQTFDGGTLMDQQVSGGRTFDVNTDGVAQYGLFPDWIEDMRRIEGPEIVEDLANGAEAYLQMWERAEAHS